MPHQINIYSCRYYNAVIDEILEDDTCTVTFEEWGNTDITQVCCFGRTQVCFSRTQVCCFGRTQVCFGRTQVCCFGRMQVCCFGRVQVCCFGRTHVCCFGRTQVCCFGRTCFTFCIFGMHITK